MYNNKPIKTISDEEINDFLNEYEYETTFNLNEAIFLFRDGTMMSGEYSYDLAGMEVVEVDDDKMQIQSKYLRSSRGLCHNVVADLMNISIYLDEKFWSKFHAATGAVRIQPETSEALVMEQQALTKAQKAIIASSGFKVIPYCEYMRSDRQINKERNRGVRER